MNNVLTSAWSGDFNIRSSTEDMYDVALLGPGNGQGFDPISTPGSWHDSFTFRSVHTQAPALNPDGGLVGSGVDDRFDFQLVTGEFLDDEGLSYIGGSYHTFGNNGTHTLNGDISSGTGASPAILSLLESVTDHLPVVADYQLPAAMGAQLASVPATVNLGDAVDISLTVENIADQLLSIVSSLGVDELDYDVSVTGDLFGAFSDTNLALGGGNTHPITLDTSTVGNKIGNVMVTSSSQAVANSLLSFPVSFEVVGTVADANFDGDGFIDGGDFLIWQRNFQLGGQTNNENGDADGSGTVDAADLAIWEQQFGNAAPLAATSIPEPSTTSLLFVSSLFAVQSRHRPKRRKAPGA